MEYRTREQWGAEFDVSVVPTIKVPVELLFVHHPVGTTTDDPNNDMLTIERIDINRFGKPSYDWGIHPSGVVLEGTTNHLSPDTYGHNSDSLSIMFMGNFEVDFPTDAAMLAGRELVMLIDSYDWLNNVRVLGHRDVYPTACPGKNLYPRIGELLVPVPPVPPIPPVPMMEVDDMLYLIHKGAKYLLAGGKITPLEKDLVGGSPIPYDDCSDRQWKFYTDTFGVPVS